MNCAFCGQELYEEFRLLEKDVILRTCWICGVGYAADRLVEYTFDGKWYLIPEGTLMINRPTGEIK
jgi:hypothetical protein